MKRRILIALFLLLSTACSWSLAAGFSWSRIMEGDACLTSEQREEMNRRRTEQHARSILRPTVSVQVKRLAAKRAHEDAVAALQTCEQANLESPDSCQVERSQAEERLRALKILAAEL